LPLLIRLVYGKNTSPWLFALKFGIKSALAACLLSAFCGFLLRFARNRKQKTQKIISKQA